MKYIVAHEKPGKVGISIEPAGKTYDHPIKCWSLNSGKRVEFALRGLQNLLKPYYVSGRFEDFAWYALSYDELCHIVRGRIGPSDDEEYHELLAQIENPQRQPREPWLNEERFLVGWNIFTHGWLNALHVIAIIIKFLATMILIPVAIAFFRKR